MMMIAKAALVLVGIMVASCAPAYKAQPLPFKAPDAYNNMVLVENLQVGGQAFADPQSAEAAFGFDIRAAGMLPIQLVFDNQAAHNWLINPAQTFLEDQDGNLWPILTDRFAYERATRYAQTNQTFREGAYKGFLGAAAGTLIGAAIGIVSGENVASAAGKGAAVGAAAGATLGGGAAYAANDARAAIINDLRDKSLQNKPISPGDLSHGIIFFPGEAKSAKQLRLQLKNEATGSLSTVYLKFQG
ncbi:MAG: glycine zipper family protein [Desulfobacteraceae bacterium]|nr:MAG: glycine zipper family protein [Desulfobacteraceae bacterium]